MAGFWYTRASSEKQEIKARASFQLYQLFFPMYLVKTINRLSIYMPYIIE